MRYQDLEELAFEQEGRRVAETLEMAYKRSVADDAPVVTELITLLDYLIDEAKSVRRNPMVAGLEHGIRVDILCDRLRSFLRENSGKLYQYEVDAQNTRDAQRGVVPKPELPAIRVINETTGEGLS